MTKTVQEILPGSMIWRIQFRKYCQDQGNSKDCSYDIARFLNWCHFQEQVVWATPLVRYCQDQRNNKYIARIKETMPQLEILQWWYGFWAQVLLNSDKTTAPFMKMGMKCVFSKSGKSLKTLKLETGSPEFSLRLFLTTRIFHTKNFCNLSSLLN